MFINKTTYDETTKIWHGIKTKLNYTQDDSLGGLLLKALRSDPEHIAQVINP